MAEDPAESVVQLVFIHQEIFVAKHSDLLNQHPVTAGFAGVSFGLHMEQNLELF